MTARTLLLSLTLSTTLGELTSNLSFSFLLLPARSDAAFESHPGLELESPRTETPSADPSLLDDSLSPLRSSSLPRPGVFSSEEMAF